MKSLFRIKYPKFLLLLATFAIAYALFADKNLGWLRSILSTSGYLGAFVAGIFFTYGFTAAPATASLLILAKSLNIVLAGIAGGFGALVGDYLIFRFIRHSFADEIEKMSKEPIISSICKNTPKMVIDYLVPVFAGIIIASPLPDEIGVALLASSKISTKHFALLSFALNTTGILIILAIGNLA